VRFKITEDRRQKTEDRGQIIIIILCLVSWVLCLFAETAFAGEKKEKIPIIVKGNRVEYLYEEKKVVAVNKVVIDYGDVSLRCDKIDVDLDKREAVASGNVSLIQEGAVTRGEKMSYNFDTGKGTILEAELRAKPWYGKGEKANKTGKKSYVLEESYMTTCNLDQPHYRIQAKEIKIYLGDKLEAKHVIACIGKWPIFYFPYYYHPLNDNRPRVTIIPGRDDKWGYYMLSAWRYYFHEWSRGYLHLDWREKQGLATGLDYKYRVGYFGKGLAKFYYCGEDDHVITDDEVLSNSNPQSERWRTHVRHKWQMDKETLFIGEYHKISDGLFLKDYFYREEYEKLNQPETYLSVVRTKRNYVLSAYARKRIHEFFTVTQKLPELKLDVKNQRLDQDTRVYYSSETAFTNFKKRFENDSEADLAAERFDTYQELSYPFKLWGALSLNPYAANRLTWYSEDSLDTSDRYRYMPIVGLESSIRFYKIFPHKFRFINLRFNEMRHLIQPSIHYLYTPTPNVKYTDLNQFDSVDELARDHRLVLELENKLQAKRTAAGNAFDLVRFIVSTDFLLNMRDPDDPDRAIKSNKTRFSDYEFILEVRPYSWLFFKSNSIWDYTRAKFETFNTDLVAKRGDKWSFSFGHRYEDARGLGKINQFVTDYSYKLSPKWNFSMYHRLKKDYEGNAYKLEEQSYGLKRDLHCWIAEFTYNIRKHTETGSDSEDDHRLWLVMRLKAYPEVPVKLFSANYSSPRPGSRDQIPE